MKKLLWLFILTAGVSLTACSSDKKGNDSSGENTETTDNDSNDEGYNSDPKNLQEAMQNAKQAMKDLQGGEQVEVVPFRELQELLPEKLAGFERISKEGETTGAMGMNVSRAEAKYKDGDDEVKIEVVDTGGLGMAMMGMAAWSGITIDKEDENGYERTSKLDGYKCYEKFRKNGRTSELAIIVEGRFLVTASKRAANEKDMDRMKKVVKDMDLSKLAKKK
jgi:hypothetical protein